VLSESFKETVKHLSMKDILVISSGTNDYNLDNFKTTFKNIKEYITSIIHTNILALGLPHRYDLQNNLDVNSKIHNINKKLSKLESILPNAHFLDSNNDRNLYTKHGLHKNKQGKRQTVAQISSLIFTVFIRNNHSGIPLTWYVLADERQKNLSVKPVDISSDVPPKVNNVVTSTRNSNCLRKAPVTRSADFLW